MSRPSNLDLIARVRELEAALAGVKERAPIRVKALLKEAVRRPEHAAAIAQEALEYLE